MHVTCLHFILYKVHIYATTRGHNTLLYKIQEDNRNFAGNIDKKYNNESIKRDRQVGSGNISGRNGGHKT